MKENIKIPNKNIIQMNGVRLDSIAEQFVLSVSEFKLMKYSRRATAPYDIHKKDIDIYISYSTPQIKNMVDRAKEEGKTVSTQEIFNAISRVWLEYYNYAVSNINTNWVNKAEGDFKLSYDCERKEEVDIKGMFSLTDEEFKEIETYSPY